MTPKHMDEIAHRLNSGQCIFHATLVRDMHTEIERLTRMLEIRDLEHRERVLVQQHMESGL